MKVPVFYGHDWTKAVGELYLTEAPDNMKWVLAPGYRVLDGETYELLEVSIIPVPAE